MAERMTILVTGGAGFIGSHLSEALLKKKFEVVCLDDFNDYYNSKFKWQNIEKAKKNKNFKLYKADIRDLKKISEIFKREKIEKIVHLAARAGIRASLENPNLYFYTNFFGTKNLLELSVKNNVKQFIFGSSSSVYGNLSKIPFSEDDLNLSPISPYGASKFSAEQLSSSFNKVYRLPILILRFFTVYGPRGRPDMAPYIFTKAIIEEKPIKKFGTGDSQRDYTYVGDIVEGIILSLGKDLEFEIINLGNSKPVSLNDFITTLEKILKKKAIIKEEKEQPGDVLKTYADIKKAKKLLGWEPKVKLEDGLKNFVNWLTTSGRIS